MKIVADTSPLNYLIQIGADLVLPELFEEVLIPHAVHQELTSDRAPASVLAWATHLPNWVRISQVAPVTPTNTLHRGELEAIQLALDRNMALAIDDKHGREHAKRLGLKVVGTLGILDQASSRGLIEISRTISRLRQTSFHVSDALFKSLLSRD